MDGIIIKILTSYQLMPSQRKHYNLILRLLISVVFLFSITSCETNKLKPLTNDATIVAFGDSLTFGVGTNIQQAYPAELEKLSGYSVINAGISGETTSQGLKRFQSVLNKYLPELVILLEGGNDILRNHSAKTTKSNLSAMIEIAKASEVNIILIGVPEKKLFSDSAPFYAEIAEEYSLVFDDDLLSDLLRSSQYKSDPIHLNSAGYQKLAEGIYQLMLDNGASK